MSTENWKLEKDLCRCCHAEGSFYNLGEPRFDLGQEEVYSDMLRHSFNIDLSPVSGILCAMTYTICEKCILRLRDASNFKRQVLLCEERFKDMYRNIMKALSPDFAVNTTPSIEVKQESPTTFDTEIKEELAPMSEDDEDVFDSRFDNDEDDEKTVLEMKLEDTKKNKGKSKPKPKAKTKKTKKVGRPSKVNELEGNEEPQDLEKNEEAEEDKKKGNRLDDFVIEIEGHKRFSCKACKVAYRRISDLRNHVIRTHLKEKFIKCVHCPETFMYHSQRKDHMYSKHSVEKPSKYVCGNCKREFRRKNTLAEHMMDVHIEKKCRLCMLKFVRKKIMFHMNEVHGIPMPTCGICGLRTLKESALVRHQRNVHLNEKDKQCSVCDKRFYTRSNLQDHMITHNQARVFKCEVCGKSFARKECYKSHYRLHSGERPFSCAMCSAAFVQRAALRFHIKSHHTPR